ncbi:vascular cell adhesion protein 1 [Pristis pectinata]|uniref:vascular cell adhesion protein 1 n=1 Tax=Pristis pectinata TaxID=685728 RepID=UPI00223DA4A1|nr:vascular cell adhesion protein 1 [Pristis pectinata]
MANWRPFLTAALALMFLLTTGYAFILELNPSGNVRSRIGEMVVLTCRVKDCPSPSFQWKVAMDNPLGGTVSNQGSESNLTFAPVTVQNEHQYTCFAKCGTETKKEHVIINVYSLSDELTLETVGNLEAGRNGTVKCTVPKVYPVRLEVDWLKGAKVVHSAKLFRHTEEEREESFTYELTPELGDSGQELTCRVHLRTELGLIQAEGTLTLQVNYPPRTINISAEPSSTVREGQDARLTCAVDSSPAATIVWSKLSAAGWSVTAGDQPILHRSPALMEHSGIYRCEASNMLGSITTEVELRVEGGPRDTTLSVTPFDVKEGGNVTISCTTHSNPPAHLLLRRKSASGWIELDSENGTFTIDAAHLDDAGHYQCQAINALGRQIKSAELFVQEKEPDIVPHVVNAVGILETVCTVAAVASVGFVLFALHYVYRRINNKKSYQMSEEKI